MINIILYKKFINIGTLLLLSIANKSGIPVEVVTLFFPPFTYLKYNSCCGFCYCGKLNTNNTDVHFLYPFGLLFRIETSLSERLLLGKINSGDISYILGTLYFSHKRHTVNW